MTPGERLEVEATTVVVAGRRIRLPHRVLEAYALTPTSAVVLYEPADLDRGWGVIRNLRAVDDTGTELWVAEPAETTSGTYYYAIRSVAPLVAGAPSYECEIDPQTGRVIRATFVK